MNETLTILSPTAMLGYGFPEASFRGGLEHEPDVIVRDIARTERLRFRWAAAGTA